MKNLYSYTFTVYLMMLDTVLSSCPSIKVCALYSYPTVMCAVAGPSMLWLRPQKLCQNLYVSWKVQEGWQ